MIFDQHPSKKYPQIKELVVIDTDNDCDIFENLTEYFPSLTNIHLDLNRISFISEKLVNSLRNLTNLSLSDNPTLKSWDPFINRLGKLKYLEELILNNCGIDQIKLDQSNQLFPSLKYLYMSDNNISSFLSIVQLSLFTIISFI